MVKTPGPFLRLFKQILMKFLHHLLGLIGWHQEAEVIAGRTVANHADVERVEYAKHLFAHAAGARQLVANDGNQCQVFFDFHAAQLRQLTQQRLRQQGADVLLVPAAFTKVTGQAHWLPLLQARAIENQCYVVAANQCGSHDGNRETWGHSVIIDPWGEILAQQGHQPGLIAASLDPQKIEHIRKTMPVQLHARLTPVWRE